MARSTPTLLSLLVLLCNCQNLSEETFSEPVTNNFLQTEEEFTRLKGAAYATLSGQFWNHYLLQELTSDEMIYLARKIDCGCTLPDLHDYSFAEPSAYGTSNDRLQVAWDFLYNGIFEVNRIIAVFEEVRAVGKAETGLIDRSIAELRAIRALYYFWLLDAFGNVPILDDFQRRLEDGVVNSPRAEVYEFVESDLLESLPLLTQEVSGETYAKMHHFAAKALLVKLYLNAEVYRGTPAWEEVITHAGEIESAGLYQIETDYFVNFNADNQASRENIFAIAYDSEFSKGFALNYFTLDEESYLTFELEVSPANRIASLEDFYNLYEDQDLRKGQWGKPFERGNFLVGPQFEADGITPLLQMPLWHRADSANGRPIVFTPSIGDPDNAEQQEGARVSKFEIAPRSGFDMDNDFPVLRYADILLAKAEALFRLNSEDAQALSLVNRIRQRAGVAAFSQLSSDNLLGERGRELFAEGWRRQDLIRFGKLDEARRFKPKTDPHFRIFPIPDEVLAQNPQLVQNPGY